MLKVRGFAMVLGLVVTDIKGTFHTPSLSLGEGQQNAKVLHAWQS